MNNSKKSLAKDIAILSLVWIPLLFMVIGGSIYKSGGFDGTIMEKLFPAIFWALIASFGFIIIVSNLFKNSEIIWYITGIIMFIITLIIYLMNLENFLIIELIVMTLSICLLSLITHIIEIVKKKSK